MDRLPLVVVFGVRLAIGSGDRLRRLIGFESQITLFVSVGARFVTQTAVAEHQVVMRLQIFRINRESLVEFRHRIDIALLQEEDAADFVVHHAIAGILRENELEARNGGLVLAFFFQDPRVKEICTRELGLEGQCLLQYHSGAAGIAFLHQGAADVHPAVGILRIDVCDFLKCRFGALQVTLQEKSDAVIIPARPVFLGELDRRRRRGSLSRKNGQRFRVFRDGDDRQIRCCFRVAGDRCRVSRLE